MTSARPPGVSWPGCGVPAGGAEVVTVGMWIETTAVVITAKDDTALRVPVVNRLKVALLHQRHAHIGVIDAHLRGDVAHLRPHGGQHVKEVVALAFEKLDVEVLVPGEFLPSPT